MLFQKYNLVKKKEIVVQGVDIIMHNIISRT